MEYYTLGRTGLKVSRLALGTLTFGTEWGCGSEQPSARRIFDMYRDAGGNIFDSADQYTGGTSERWLGEFVRESGSRDNVVIATKYSMNDQPDPNVGGNARKYMMRAVEDSLQRLGTDYIDLYYMHCWDRLTPPDEVMRGFDDLVTQGKIRYAGLSDVPAWYASRAMSLSEFRGWTPIAALQLEYSLVERSIEHEFVDLGAALGAGIVCWSPLGAGLLSGKYKPSQRQDDNAGRLGMMQDSTNPAVAKFTERNWQIVAELEKVAAEIDQPMAATALNWAVNRPGIASVLIGATRPEQLQSNLKALDFTIPRELQDRLTAASMPPAPFPYSFFGAEVQAEITGGVTVGRKPSSYYKSGGE